jgi:hypothetical protein
VFDTSTLPRSGGGVLLDLSNDPARFAWLREAVGERVAVVSAAPFGGLDTVLLRPDGYVAMASSELFDPRPAVQHWFGR